MEQPTIEKLKAMAYDRVLMIEKTKQELDAINRELGRMIEEQAKTKDLLKESDKNIEKKNAPKAKV